jgi:transposase
MDLTPTRATGHRLQAIINKVLQHLFAFAGKRDFIATNNGSELPLRPCVVYRKITNGFRMNGVSDPSSKSHGKD